MDSAELKARQAPIKELYKTDAAAALVTLRATGQLGEGVTCSVETGRALVKAGLHPASGGVPVNVCSGDMLLQALVACAGVTLNAVATSLGFPVTDARITAEGDIDFRGTLGVDRTAPVGLTAVRLCFEIDGPLDEKQRETLLRLTERYCVVLQTLRNPPPVASTVTAGAAGAPPP